MSLHAKPERKRGEKIWVLHAFAGKQVHGFRLKMRLTRDMVKERRDSPLRGAIAQARLGRWRCPGQSCGRRLSETRIRVLGAYPGKSPGSVCQFSEHDAARRRPAYRAQILRACGIAEANLKAMQDFSPNAATAFSHFMVAPPLFASALAAQLLSIGFGPIKPGCFRFEGLGRTIPTGSWGRSLAQE